MTISLVTSSLAKSILPAMALLVVPFWTPLALADVPDKRTISLSATGTVKTVPDKVDITTGVTSEDPTARGALDKNTDAMTKIVAGLKASGIDPKDIQTTNFSVSPVYRKSKQSYSSTITGYRVTNQVHIVVRDVEKLGPTLDKVVSLGANQINSIRFGVLEPEPLKDKARAEAVRNAVANAKVYAEAAGVELGPVLTIAEDGGTPLPRPGMAATRMEMASAVPIEAGTAAIQVRVRMTWELKSAGN